MSKLRKGPVEGSAPGLGQNSDQKSQARTSDRNVLNEQFRKALESENIDEINKIFRSLNVSSKNFFKQKYYQKSRHTLKHNIIPHYLRKFSKENNINMLNFLADLVKPLYKSRYSEHLAAAFLEAAQNNSLESVILISKKLDLAQDIKIMQDAFIAALDNNNDDICLFFLKDFNNFLKESYQNKSNIFEIYQVYDISNFGLFALYKAVMSDNLNLILHLTHSKFISSIFTKKYLKFCEVSNFMTIDPRLC